MLSFARPVLTCFEGEGEGAKEGAGEGEVEKKFSQEDVNTMMAEEKRKTQVAQRKQASELEELKRGASLTVEQKETLETQIDELKTQYMTTKERAERAKEEADKKSDNLIMQLTQQRDDANASHSRLVIANAITSASSEHKAISAEQISAILAPSTKLTETLDESGNPTGVFAPTVTFEDIDKDGKAIVLELPIREAVKRMRELPKHGNLFEGDKAGGLGQRGNQGTPKKVDLKQLALNPAEYRRMRKEKPELFT